MVDTTISVSTLLGGGQSFITVSDETSTLPNSVILSASTANTNGMSGITVFTAGGTWNKPAGFTSRSRIVVEVVGSGGGGGGAAGAGSGAAAGGGGSGGGFTVELLANGVLGATETVTIGAGGIAGTHLANAGTGGTCSFGAHCSATGGAGGISDLARSTVHGPGGSGASNAGIGVGGDIIIYGSAGDTGLIYSTVAIGGSGGGSKWAGVRRGPVGGVAGSSGRGYGGGASGAATVDGTNRNGGVGAVGAVIVYEFE